MRYFQPRITARFTLLVMLCVCRCCYVVIEQPRQLSYALVDTNALAAESIEEHGDQMVPARIDSFLDE